MHTEANDDFIGSIADGGQGHVGLVRLALRAAEAEELSRSGWVVHGVPGDRGPGPRAGPSGRIPPGWEAVMSGAEGG